MTKRLIVICATAVALGIIWALSCGGLTADDLAKIISLFTGGD